MERSIADRSDWNSVLDPDQGTLTLKIKACVLPATAGEHHFTVFGGLSPVGIPLMTSRSVRCGSPQGDDVSNFQNDFWAAIDRDWNGKLVLRTHSHRVCNPNELELRCKVEIAWVGPEDPAQLVIVVLFHPEGDVRATCLPIEPFAFGALLTRTYRGLPVDMVCADIAVNDKIRQDRATSDRGECDFTQRPVSHELGHYLGLLHTCWSVLPWEWGTGTEYCSGSTYWEQDNIMAVGSEVRAEHATPWLNRVGEHGYQPGRTWVPLAPHATAEP